MNPILKDITEGMRYAWRVWWKWTVGLTLLMMVLFCIGWAMQEEQRGVLDFLWTALVGLIYSAFHCGVVALFVAAIALTWRLVGWALLVPVIVVPLFIALVFWMGGGVLEGIYDRLALALGENFHPPRMGGGCHNGLGAVLLVFYLGYLVFTCVTTWSILSQILLFVLVVAIYLLLALVAGVGLSLPFLCRASVRRYRRRSAG